jgi:hypothetical protein
MDSTFLTGVLLFFKQPLIMVTEKVIKPAAQQYH